SIEVVVAPDPPFRGSGKLMLDEELGDLNYGDGQWLGFLKNDATIYLYFNEETPIQQVLLNMLKRTREHVFPPVRVEVWGGMNKNDLKLLGKIEPPRPKEHGENTLIQEKV